MAFKKALLERLRRVEGLTQLLGKTRSSFPAIGWDQRPTNSSYPAAVLSIVRDPRGRTMTGLQGSRGTRVQIDVMGLDSGAVEAVAETVVAILALGAVVESVRFSPARDIETSDMGEQTDTVFVHRTMIDLVLWHRMEN